MSDSRELEKNDLKNILERRGKTGLHPEKLIGIL